MHRSFAAWLSAHPWRVPWFTALFGALSSFGFLPIMIVAGALPVFGLLHQGPEGGRRAFLVGTAALAGSILLLAGSPWVAVVFVATLIWLPYALGVLLYRTHSLTLCFQVTVLGAAILLGMIFLLIDDPIGYLQRVVDELVHALKQAGVPDAEEALSRMPGLTNWGLYISVGMLVLLGMLFLGRWWQTLLDAPGAFGQEYRQLRLGKGLGTLAMLVVIAALGAALMGQRLAAADAWLWIAVAALACQGLAAAHERHAQGLMGRGWLTAIYVLLILPIGETMLLDIALLAGWGLADNWRKSRSRAA